MTQKFQGKQLDLLEANFNAQKENNQKKSDSLQKISETLVKRKYIYAIQFALRHPDSEVAPFIALTDLVNANVQYLDSIHNTLTDKVKKSLYGEKLGKLITEIKNTEKGT